MIVRLPEELGDLGMCCVCGEENDSARNVIDLMFRAPIEGTGWYCGVCSRASNGAIAVLCDECVALDDPIAQLRWVVRGIVNSRERIAIEDALREPIEHDAEQHEQFKREMEAITQAVAIELNATQPFGFSPN